MFPEGISNSSRFPGFSEVADTLTFLQASTCLTVKFKLNGDCSQQGLLILILDQVC